MLPHDRNEVENTQNLRQISQCRARISDRSIETADEAFCSLLGSSQADLIGMELSALYRTAEGFSQFLDRLNDIAEREGDESIATTWCRPDGTVVEVLVQVRSLQLAHGRRWVLVAFDLTDLHKTARLAHQDEETLRTILDHSPMGFGLLIMDPSGDRVMGWYNKAMGSIFGYGPEDLIGKSSRMLYGDDESFRKSGLHIKSELDNKGLCDFEVQLVRSDQSLIYARIITVPVNMGNEISLLTIVEDVSARKRAELALRESEKRLETIVRAAPSGIGMIKDRKLTWCNQAMCDLSGYAFDEMTGRDTRFLYLDDATYETAGRDTYGTLAETGEGSCETTMVNKDGHKVDVIVRVALIDPDDPGSPMVATIADVTELKRAQAEREELREQLNHAQKMESVGRLAGGVAHDFNNLLTGITGNVSLAMLDAAPNDPLLNHLKQIDKAAQSGANLTRQLLLFSRKQIALPRTIDLNQLISTMHNLLIRLIGEDVELRIVLGSQQGLIKADPGQVEQVVVNLAVNARDAMPEGGRLVIETDQVTLDESYCQQYPEARAGEFVMLAVSDSGVGMDTEIYRRAFEPFFTTKQDGYGTGLGLSIVHGIVKRHQGHLEVLSEPSLGTTFKAYFPMASEAQQSVESTAADDELPRGRETVLVVEDDHMVREIAVLTLKRQGYDVLQADSGAAALALVKADQPKISLLVSDVIMPKMNGRELSEKLLASLPELKVLFVSGYTASVISPLIVLEPGFEFLGKPYTPKDLAQRVRIILDS